MLDEFATSIDVEAAIETRLTYGGAAEEIARIASDERASVVVMSLGSAATRGRGQLPGSVAYGVLCLAPTPILALPETPAGRFYVAHLQPAAGVETP
jgi:hypothetical protein